MAWGHSSSGQAVDLAAAGIFAAAVAFAAFALGGGLLAVAGSPAALILAYSGLRQTGTGRTHRLAAFDLASLDAPHDGVDEASDGKVVRLFDPRQLAIARPSTASPGGVPEDAGQALSDALAQLKRSLR